MKKVVVGMSGGVDSSVAAYLLKKEGYDVLGLFMKNWEEKDASGLCTSTQDYEDAQRVCEILDIPLYTVNFVQEYWNGVFSQFVQDLQKGLTPNPDILCNSKIKFDAFFKKTKSLGADFLATGHYCRAKGQTLLKGLDPRKDQSYFLHSVPRTIFPEVLFPIGALEKSAVRQIAREQNLPNSQKKDSTGICFIGKRNFKEFVKHYIPYHPGNFENLCGEVMGRHDGTAYYTLGQRKGLGIGGPGEAWFVVGKDIKRNVVVIEQGEDHPALYKTELTAHSPTFIPETLPFYCKAKVRYRQEDQECVIEEASKAHMHVCFTKPQRAITPGQSIVFYNEAVCLGGAVIAD